MQVDDIGSDPAFAWRTFSKKQSTANMTVARKRQNRVKTYSHVAESTIGLWLARSAGFERLSCSVSER